MKIINYRMYSVVTTTKSIMAQSQKIRTSSFIYRSPVAQDDEHYVVTVTVKELLDPAGESYIDLYYEFDAKMLKDARRRHVATHPLNGHGIPEFMEYKGEIIARNPMTSAMVDYLLMDDAELRKFTGHTTPQDYKHKIMLSLSYLWD